MTVCTVTSGLIKYGSGFYYREGNRIFMTEDVTPPGIIIKLDTRKIETGLFSNLFTLEVFDGISYEVEGWANVTICNV